MNVLGRRGALAALAVGATLIAALPARALDSAADLTRHLGPLANFVAPGESGAWTIDADEEAVRLSNRTDPAAIQYYWTEPPALGSDFVVRGAFDAEPGPGGEVMRAGLLFDFDPAGGYVALTIGSDGGAHGFLRTREGFRRLPAPEARPRLDGADEIEVRVRGQQADVTLNGETMFGLRSEDGFSHNLGVIAIGAGVASVTGFRAAPSEPEG